MKTFILFNNNRRFSIQFVSINWITTIEKCGIKRNYILGHGLDTELSI